MGKDQLQIMIQLTILLQEESLISKEEKAMTLRELNQQHIKSNEK